MTSRGLTRCWSLFGLVGILTIALSNAGCCSHRKAVNESRAEATEQMRTATLSESRSEEKREATRTQETESRGETVTEIEIYDTTQPPDTMTGKRPLKARIRQRHGTEATARATTEGHATRNTEATAKAEQVYEGGELSEVTVTAEKPPGLWERMKQGASWATAIMILAAAGWIVYKIKKRKKT